MSGWMHGGDPSSIYREPKPKKMHALDWTFVRGWRAAENGESAGTNPFGDSRTDRGSVTWSRAFWRAWKAGWTAKITLDKGGKV